MKDLAWCDGAQLLLVRHSPMRTGVALMCAACLQGERLVPMYVQRSLDGYPHVTPLAGLNAGVDAVARSQDSPLVLLCSQRLSARILQLAGPPQSHGGIEHKGAHPAGELARLLAHVLTVVDLQVGWHASVCRRCACWASAGMRCICRAACPVLPHAISPSLVAFSHACWSCMRPGISCSPTNPVLAPAVHV